MKISITKETKNWLKIADLEGAKQMVKDLREEDSTVEEYAKMAAIAITDDNSVEIIRATAEFEDHIGIWNFFNDESHRLDVKISFVATYWDGDSYCFMQASAYLSNIYQSNGTDEYKAFMRHTSHVKKFVEAK